VTRFPRPAVAPILLAVAAGCGLLGADDALPEPACRFPRGWRDLGPAPVCLGEALAVPTRAADGTVGGLCVRGDSPPCARDVECAAPERCRCGRCRVLRCRTTDDCGPGESCIPAIARCAVPCDPARDDSCPSGDACHLGGCVRRCGRDDDCAHGESCSPRGRCVVSPCTTDTGCGEGRRCERQTVAADVIHPDLVSTPDGLRVLAEVRRDGRSAVHRLVPAEYGTLHDPDALPILAPAAEWEDDRTGAPDAIPRDDGFLLLYAAGDDRAVALAELSATLDLVRRAERPWFVPDAPWEEGRAADPGGWTLPDGRLAVAYVAGTPPAVGLAAGDPAAGPPERIAAGPVLRPAAAAVADRWRDLDAIAGPDPVPDADAGAAWIFFSAHGRVGPPGAPVEPDWSLGLARVDPADGWSVRSDPAGPVLAERYGPGVSAGRGESSPGVGRGRASRTMLYADSDSEGFSSGLRWGGCAP
jgi:hypothetical protein